MTKTSKAFTLAEVLTTLMVIGVVAAMTIPTLINSTEDQQHRVALKKAVSVLGQAIQLNVAKEVECTFTAANAANELANCVGQSLSGTVNGDKITTADGISFKFFAPAIAASSLESLCGSSFNTGSLNGLKGAGNCGVIVDTNGLSKGTKEFPSPNFDANGFSGDEPAVSDQFELIVSSNGVRPVFTSVAASKGYGYVYGTPENDAAVLGNKSCRKAKGTNPETYDTQTVAKNAACNSLGQGWEDVP